MDSQKVAIITAASRGIGAGCARELADSIAELEGWNVPSDLMLGRPTTYAEFAKIIAFLISDDAKFITGTTLKVDEAYSSAI